MSEDKKGKRCIFHYDMACLADLDDSEGASMHEIMCEHEGMECEAFPENGTCHGMETYLAIFADGTDFVVYAHELEELKEEERKPMKRMFTVYYREVIEHEFEYEAEYPEEAERKFNEDAEAGVLDFSDGEVIEGGVDHIEDTTENSLYFDVYNALLKMFTPEYGSRMNFLIRSIMEDVKSSSDYPRTWSDTDIKLATARVLLKKTGQSEE